MIIQGDNIIVNGTPVDGTKLTNHDKITVTTTGNVGFNTIAPDTDILGNVNSWMSPSVAISGSRPTLFLKGNNLSSLATIRIWPGGNDYGNLTQIDDWHVNISKSTDTVGSNGNFGISPRGGSLGAGLKIDTSGRVNFPLQPMACATKDNGAGWETLDGVIVCNNVKVNVGNHYSTSTGVFTCPVAGKYRVRAQGLSGNNGVVHIRPQLNGINISASGAHCNITGAAYYSMSAEYTVQCSTNDQLHVHIYSTNGGFYTGGEYATVLFELIA